MRRRLIVHPAKSSTFSIERDAAFDYARIEFVLGKLPFRPTVRKEATCVLKPIRLYDECPLELCFLKDHTVIEPELSALPYAQFWNRNDEFSATQPVYSLLFEDFLRKIPG